MLFVYIYCKRASDYVYIYCSTMKDSSSMNLQYIGDFYFDWRASLFIGFMFTGGQKVVFVAETVGTMWCHQSHNDITVSSSLDSLTRQRTMQGSDWLIYFKQRWAGGFLCVSAQTHSTVVRQSVVSVVDFIGCLRKLFAVTVNLNSNSRNLRVLSSFLFSGDRSCLQRQTVKQHFIDTHHLVKKSCHNPGIGGRNFVTFSGCFHVLIPSDECHDFFKKPVFSVFVFLQECVILNGLLLWIFIF